MNTWNFKAAHRQPTSGDVLRPRRDGARRRRRGRRDSQEHENFLKNRILDLILLVKCYVEATQTQCTHNFVFFSIRYCVCHRKYKTGESVWNGARPLFIRSLIVAQSLRLIVWVSSKLLVWTIKDVWCLHSPLDGTASSSMMEQKLGYYCRMRLMDYTVLTAAIVAEVCYLCQRELWVFSN